MPTEVVMPQMGESIAEGTITKWLKSVGDHVERDEPLFEISTDKVDAEIPSPAAGTLTDIKFKEGDTVEINTVVAVLDGEGAKPSVEVAAAKDQEAPAQAEAPQAEAKPAPVVKNTPPPAAKPAAQPAPVKTAKPEPVARPTLVRAITVASNLVAVATTPLTTITITSTSTRRTTRAALRLPEVPQPRWR